MELQAKYSNDLFYELGIEFHNENFAKPILKEMSSAIQDLFQLGDVKPKEKLKRKILIWLYFKQHHLQSLVKKPGFLQRTFYDLISNIYGYRI
ncbi:hypothetical protein EGI22_09205 [Lacihabitans sp. LS3-19]|uniref:hypothetical protein n=1 Tax=Lacihabitans sp. LS3-19 TaxID=2487335 RepID=UPI0020CCC2F1|nr:hypothetical protein [Lacihabitans sp. LS3-19]MCP9768090.1 hypothetical protein [Lacihabitans sp. LS3-19]